MRPCRRPAGEIGRAPVPAELGAILDKRRERVAPLGSTQVVTRDLIDKRDDASPQCRLLYPHKRLGEREPIACCEEFGHIAGRRRLPNSLWLPRQMRCAFEEERHWDLQKVRDVL